MNEMVERVAVAMYRANPEHKRNPFHKAERWLQDQAREMARAAITEMREPTFGMIEAMNFLHKNEALKTWQDVIDEALKAPSLTSHKDTAS
jgi:hypothetical protein